MSRFYTYCYLNENNIPYYIGKGTGRRAYHVHDNVSVPPKDRILILKILKYILKEIKKNEKIVENSCMNHLEINVPNANLPVYWK